MVNIAGPICFAIAMLALGVVCLWRPDIVQSYAIRSLQEGARVRRSLDFVRSDRYRTFVRLFSIFPFVVSAFITWMLLKP